MCHMWEFNLAMGGSPCPIDIDSWAFYSLPVLGQSGYLVGAKSDTALSTSRVSAPKQGASQFPCRLIANGIPRIARYRIQ